MQDAALSSQNALGNPEYYANLAQNSQRTSRAGRHYDDYSRDEHPVKFYPTAVHGTLKCQRVQPCGHKFVSAFGSEPRHRHCEACWFSFFTIYQELLKEADELFRGTGPDQGEQALVALKGRTFTSNFKKYLSTLAQWNQVMEAAKQNDLARLEEQHHEQLTVRGTGIAGIEPDSTDSTDSDRQEDEAVYSSYSGLDNFDGADSD